MVKSNAPRPFFGPELTITLHISFLYYQMVLFKTDSYCYIRCYMNLVAGATKTQVVNRVRIEPEKIFEKCHRYIITTQVSHQ